MADVPNWTKISFRNKQDPYAENFDDEMMEFPKRMPKKTREPKEKKPK